MRRLKLVKDGVVVAAVAVVTAAGVLAVFRPRAVVAEGEAKAAPVERPTLKADGVVLTLVTDKQKYEAGEKPRLTLTAVNTGPRPASVNVVLAMLTTEAGPPMRRMMPGPKESWRHECALKLDPSETKTVEVATDKALAAGQAVFINLLVGKTFLNAARFTVPGADTFAPSPANAKGLAKVLAAAKESGPGLDKKSPEAKTKAGAR